MIPEDMHRFLQEWKVKEKTFKRDIENEILPYISNKNVVFLYGPRRSGKSVIAKRLLDKMPKSSTTRYVNLEDPGLMDTLNIKLMDEFASGLKAKDTIIFDEVQVIKGWEKWIRKAVDTRKCQIIVTGSSAELLSGEFATALGGRGIGFQVLPLSFKEFNRVTKKNFEEYLKIGGYPEVVLNPAKKEKLLESYFELALIKDIISRHNVRDVNALRNLAFYLLTNSGKETSLKKIRMALGLSYDTIKQFIAYLEASFLIFQVPYFSYSLKESLIKQRKVYSWDLGMQQYASKSFTADFGRLAETAIAIELQHRKYDLYYWKEKNEVDFVARKKAELTPINVCYSKTLPKREMQGLKEFNKKYKLKKSKILFLGKDTKKEDEIEIKNLEKWLTKN